MELRKNGFSALTLKWIAIVTMVIDHTGVTCYKWLGLSKNYWLLRRIGRSAFPIFAFLLVEGFRHTRNRRAYLRNLLIFAVISEIPFDLIIMRKVWDCDWQNVFWTLSLGLLTVTAVEKLWIRCERGPILRFLRWPLALIPVAAGLILCDFLKGDYSLWGVLLIVLIYAGEEAAARWSVGQRARNLGAVCAAVLWMCLYDLFRGRLIELYGLFAVVPILLYNGQRGQYRLPKWFFYGVYPAHFLILYVLRDTLFKQLLT